MSSFGKLPSRRKGSFSNNYLRELPYKPSQPRLNPSRSIAMYQLNELNDYHVVDRPILSKSKKKHIEEKLALDEQVRRQVDERQKDDNFFLKYDRNPLSDHLSHHNLNPHRQSKEAVERKKSAKNPRIIAHEERNTANKPKGTIIQAVNEIKENNFVRDRSPMQRINSYQDASTHFIKSAQAIKVSPKPKRQAIKANPTQPKQLSIDDLVAMEDSNFYAKSLKDLNIFQIARGNHGPIVTRSVLDKYHFSHESMVDRIGSLKLSFLRDISRISRAFVLNKDLASTASISFINSAEIAVRLSDVRFVDLMNISSGRFSPEMAYTASNQENIDLNSSSSSANINEIDYYEKARNLRNSCIDPHQERHEVIEYHRIENSEEEVKFQRFVDRIYQNVKAGLGVRSKLIQLTIQDNREHKRIAGIVQENTSYLANMDVRKHKGSIERQITANKQDKNRKEALLIRKLLQTISLQNREEHKIQQLLKGNPK